LVNLQGELIGINTAIFSRTGGYMGIGFAIPSNMVKNVMNNLVDHGKVIRGWLGVSIQQLTPELADQFGSPDASGALVGDVVSGSPAENAGLQRGDIIRHYNGTKVKDPTHLRSLVAETSPGTSASVSVLRHNSPQELSVAIGELPSDLTAMRSSDPDQQKNHALSGIIVEPVPPDRVPKDEGVLISRVQPDSAAERAGLRRGDILMEINRSPTRHVDDFHRLTRDLGPKTPVLILLKRGNGTIYLSIKP
ncbi:MAG: PDZ domain-containing protein, partial [Nitrospirales bacterium]